MFNGFEDMAEEIEQFWVANTEQEDLGNTMWAYGKHGLTVRSHAFLYYYFTLFYAFLGLVSVLFGRYERDGAPQ